MRILVRWIILLCSLPSWAQRECGSSNYIETIKSSNPSIAKSMAAADAFSNQAKEVMGSAGRTLNQPVIHIPVVVHVLYHSASQNISDAQIKSQIAALNRDFRRDNSDSVNTPDRFKSIAADMAIEFELAASDPQGAVTTGIVRKQTWVKEWTNDDKIKFSATGGDDAWDSKSYLNIWIGDMHRLLGYSSAPGGPPDRDGLVIAPIAFGTINVAAPYDMGRTAVHEAGHWLGLKHIWGDTYCGDDGIADTPKQGNYTQGCPNGFRSSCSNGELGDMYMNYMDFTYDACTNLFTRGQKEKIHSLFMPGGPRASLLQSKGLFKPWNFTANATDEIAAETLSPKPYTYPNPAMNMLSMEMGSNENWIGKELRIISMSGNVVRKLTVGSKIQRIDVSALRAGMYMIQGEAGGQKIAQTFVKL